MKIRISGRGVNGLKCIFCGEECYSYQKVHAVVHGKYRHKFHDECYKQYVKIQKKSGGEKRDAL